MDIYNLFTDFAKNTNLSVIETTVYLVILALLVWLTNEFKTQYHTDKNTRTVRNDRALSAFSKVLAAGYQFKDDPTKNKEFFVLVYESIPSMDAMLFKDIFKIVDDDNLSEKQKIHKLTNVVTLKVMELTEDNISFSGKGPFNKLVAFCIRIKEIGYPIISACLTLTVFGVFFLLSITETNEFFQTSKPVAFVLGFLFLIVVVEMFFQKKLKKISYILIPIILLLLVFIIGASSLLFSIFSCFIVLILNALFLKYGIYSVTS